MEPKDKDRLVANGQVRYIIGDIGQETRTFEAIGTLL